MFEKWALGLFRVSGCHLVQFSCSPTKSVSSLTSCLWDIYMDEKQTITFQIALHLDEGLIKLCSPQICGKKEKENGKELEFL